MPRSEIGADCDGECPDLRDAIGGGNGRGPARIGFVLSCIAAVIYAITYISLVADPTVEIPINFMTVILLMAFAPFIVAFAVIGIIVIIGLAIGVILIAAGKSKAGGIVVIVFSGIGVFMAAFCYFIPLGLGIAGGIVAIVGK
jgi:hypothetical protein